MQRLGRVRVRHLHLPALSGARHRGMRPDGAEGRRRADRLQSQGRPGARRGDEVPGLQCAQAPGRRRSGGDLFRAHRMRRRRAGCPLPAAHARRAALARDRPHRSLRVDVEHEIRRYRPIRHRYRRPHPDSRRARARRRQGRDRGEESRGILCARESTERGGPQGGPRPQDRRVLNIASHRRSDEHAAARSLLTAAAVRERAHEMLGLDGRLRHFSVDLDRLAACADFVAAVIRETYPALAVPPHARWRHFVVAGRDQWAAAAESARWADPAAKARAAFDLATVSVLLDAGAGPDWRYHDPVTSRVAGRSEGLALATFRMFEAGMFSADARDPRRADAVRLAALTADDLAAGFQANEGNPLPGIAGRAALIARLGATVAANPAVFANLDG